MASPFPLQHNKVLQIHCKEFRPIPDPIPNHFVDLPNWFQFFSGNSSHRALFYKIPNQCSRKERKLFHLMLEYKYHISCYVVTLNQSSRNFTKYPVLKFPEYYPENDCNYSRPNILKLSNLSRFFICNLNLAREFLCQNICSVLIPPPEMS